MTSPIEPRTGSDWSRAVPVAHAGLGQQMVGPGRVVFQLAPEPGHVEAEVVGPRLVARAPDLGQQLAGRDPLCPAPGPRDSLPATRHSVGVSRTGSAAPPWSGSLVTVCAVRSTTQWPTDTVAGLPGGGPSARPGTA